MRAGRIASACIGITALVVVGLSGCSSSSKDASSSQQHPTGPTITTGAADSKKSPINILFYGSDTGAAAQYASIVRPPEKLAVEHINQDEGGINGHPLRVTIVDAQMDPAQAVQLLHANSSTPVALVGIFSEEFAAVGPLAKTAKIPFVTEASASDLMAKGRPYVWSVSPDTARLSSQATDKWLKAVPSLKKVVVVEDKFDAFFDSQAGAVEKELKAKGVSVTGVGFSADTTNFAPLASRIKSEHPDGVVLGGTASSGAAMLSELRRQGVNASILATQGVYTGSFNTAAGKAANNIYAYLPLYLGTSASTTFVEKYKALVGADPTWAAGECYEMFEVIAQAMRQAHVESLSSLSAQRAATQEQLAKTSIVGVAGETISFGADGLSTRSGSLIYQGDNGSVKLVS